MAVLDDACIRIMPPKGVTGDLSKTAQWSASRLAESESTPP